jgi:hypothetical protein
MFGERAEQTHDAEVFAIGMVTGSLVSNLLAGAKVCAKVAEVLVTSATAHATTARGNEPKHDMVAGLQPTHSCAHLSHDTRALVAADDWQLKRQIARHQVFIAMAHTRCG